MVSDVTFIVWLTVALFALRVAVEYILPPKWHFSTNVLAAFAAVTWADYNGLSLRDIKLRPEFSWLDLSLILGAILACYVILYASTKITFFRNFYLSNGTSSMSRRKIIKETAWRIPMGTALTEEVMFRGVLLGAFMMVLDATWSVVWSGIIFGFWHAFGPLKAGGSIPAILKRTTGHIVATSLGGMLMGVLCLWSSSVIMPWLFHWTLNASGMLTVHYTKKKHGNSG